MCKRLSKRPLTLENDVLKVELDQRFPKVLKYLYKPNDGVLHGGLTEETGAVEINGERFITDSLEIDVESDVDSAKYTLRVPHLCGSASFVVGFRLEDNVVTMVIDRIVEKGFDFLLRTIYFPTHRLLTGKRSDGASIFRSEFYRRSWHLPMAKGLFEWLGDRVGQVDSFQPENNPRETYWAMVYTDKVLGTIHSTTPVFPLQTQLTGTTHYYAVYEGELLAANEFSIWNSPYHYRVQDEVVSPFLCKIALLDDLNGDGRIDWKDGATWLRTQIPDANPLYDDTFMYKIFCALPPDRVYATFDQCLEMIEKINSLTNGAKQIVYLVGWQHGGHDDKYPDLSVVNARLGGGEKLIDLVEEAKRFNAIVSLHVNFDDAYQDSPAWDPQIISTDIDGDLQKWEVFNNRQAYHISHYKDVKKGSAYSRIDSLLDLLPIRQSIHLDAFRYTNESWDPDGHKDMMTELVLGCWKIIDHFKHYGVDVTTEGFFPGLDHLTGRITGYWHLPPPRWRFVRFLMHRKWCGGNASGTEERIDPEGVVFGESVGWDFSNDTPMTRICDEYYLKTLLCHHLRRYEMTNIFDDGKRLTIEYGKTCTATFERDSGNISVMSNEITIARNNERFIPVNEREILAYSKSGGSTKWTLPATWHGKGKIRVFRLTESGRRNEERFTTTDEGEIILNLEPQQPYLIIGETE